MPIKHTRALLGAALDGSLAKVAMRIDPHFGLRVPESCPGVPAEILDPRATWADPAAYDRVASDVVARFRENFRKFEAYVDEHIRAAEPKAA